MCLNIFVWSLIAASYTTLQSVALLTINILFIVEKVNNCSTFSTDSWFGNTTEHYFCESSRSGILSADAVFAYEITYAIIHVLWIIGGIVILLQVCRKRQASNDYIMWLVMACISLLMDTTTGIFFATDIKEQGVLAWTMMLISFRLILCYVVNIVFVIVVFWAMILAKKATVEEDNYRHTSGKTSNVGDEVNVSKLVTSSSSNPHELQQIEQQHQQEKTQPKELQHSDTDQRSVPREGTPRSSSVPPFVQQESSDPRQGEVMASTAGNFALQQQSTLTQQQLQQFPQQQPPQQQFAPQQFQQQQFSQRPQPFPQQLQHQQQHYQQQPMFSQPPLQPHQQLYQSSFRNSSKSVASDEPSSYPPPHQSAPVQRTFGASQTPAMQGSFVGKQNAPGMRPQGSAYLNPAMTATRSVASNNTSHYENDDYYEYDDDDDTMQSLNLQPKFPPPRGVKRVVSANKKTRHAPQPPTPKIDYSAKDESPEPKKIDPVVPILYDLRPFSYINPGFRPADHAAVNDMKTHKADIVETLDNETKQLRELHDLTGSDSDGSGSFAVRSFLTDSGRRQNYPEKDPDLRKQMQSSKLGPHPRLSFNSNSPPVVKRKTTVERKPSKLNTDARQLSERPMQNRDTAENEYDESISGSEKESSGSLAGGSGGSGGHKNQVFITAV